MQVYNYVPKNGYAFVYTSNSSDENVYFDDFKVTFQQGALVDDNHYYPFGLKIAGASSHLLADQYEMHIDNQNLYNDKELIEDGGLNWYDYGFRSYDAQIGRFLQLDPLTDDYTHYTPYQYAGNEPISNVDVDGLEEASAILGVADGWLKGVIKNNPIVFKWLQEVIVTPAVHRPLLGQIIKGVADFQYGFGKGVLSGAVSALKAGAVFSSPFNVVEQVQMIQGMNQSFQMANYLSPWDPLKGLGALYGLEKYNRFANGNWMDKGEVTGELAFDFGSFFIPGGEASSFVTKLGTETGVAAKAGSQGVNRIYSARELMRRAAEPGPYHNFPESFNQAIFSGSRTVTPNYFKVAKPGLTNTNIKYEMPGMINGVEGVFEIGVRPSLSGNTEVIWHRFFQRYSKKLP